MAANDAQMQKLLKENPGLVLADDDHNAAAKNCRKLLKAAFPGVKFKVNTHRYAGGSSLNVSWTDGPTDAQVEEIAHRFQGGRFDGMEDIYNYEHTAWTALFGWEKYVMCNRDLSDEAITRVACELANEYGAKAPALEDFHSGALSRTSPIEGAQGDPHWSWSSLIRRQARSMVL